MQDRAELLLGLDMYIRAHDGDLIQEFLHIPYICCTFDKKGEEENSGRERERERERE